MRIRHAKAKTVAILLMLSALLAAPVMAQNGPYRTDFSVNVRVHGGGTVVLEPQNGAPEADKPSVTVQNGEKGTFSFSYSQPDTFEYKLYQKPGKDKSMKYDGTVYLLTVQVQASDKGLSTVYAIDTKDGKKDSIVFENKRVVPGKPGTPGKKTINVQTGDEPPYLALGLFGAAAIAAAGAMIVLPSRKEEESHE